MQCIASLGGAQKGPSAWAVTRYRILQCINDQGVVDQQITEDVAYFLLLFQSFCFSFLFALSLSYFCFLFSFLFLGSAYKSTEGEVVAGRDDDLKRVIISDKTPKK